VARGSGGLTPRAVLSAARGARGAASGSAIVVDGAPALVAVLARELRAGGDTAAVREGFSDPRTRRSARSVAALVWIGEPDQEALRAAARDRIPIVAVTDAENVPYVLATDLVRVQPGQGFPVEQIAAALARRLGDRAPSLAAALPVLRRPVVDELIRSAARKNAFLAAGVVAPGADMRVLTLSQVGLAMRIALAHGREIDRSRATEVLAVVGAGFGFRALAREGLGLPPGAGRAFKGAIAFAGTTAVGEAARRVFSTPP
jgi:uncharacterized protein (DUF697 family)